MNSKLVMAVVAVVVVLVIMVVGVYFFKDSIINLVNGSKSSSNSSKVSVSNSSDIQITIKGAYGNDLRYDVSFVANENLLALMQRVRKDHEDELEFEYDNDPDEGTVIIDLNEQKEDATHEWGVSVNQQEIKTGLTSYTLKAGDEVIVEYETK